MEVVRLNSPETVKRGRWCNCKIAVYHVWKPVVIRRYLTTGNTSIYHKMNIKEHVADHFTSIPEKIHFQLNEVWEDNQKQLGCSSDDLKGVKNSTS